MVEFFQCLSMNANFNKVHCFSKFLVNLTLFTLVWFGEGPLSLKRTTRPLTFANGVIVAITVEEKTLTTQALVAALLLTI